MSKPVQNYLIPESQNKAASHVQCHGSRSTVSIIQNEDNVENNRIPAMKLL